MDKLTEDLRQLIIHIGSPNYGVRYGAGPLGSILPFSETPCRDIPEDISSRLYQISQIRYKKIPRREFEGIASRLIKVCAGLHAVVIACGSLMIFESR